MKYPLRLLLPAVLMLVGLFAAATAVLTSVYLSTSHSEDTLTELLTVIGNQTSADVAIGIREGDAARTRGAIEQLQVMRDLELALLIDDNNRIVHATNRRLIDEFVDASNFPQVEAMVDAARQDGTFHTMQGGKLYQASLVGGQAPVLLSGERPGHVLLVSYDYAAVQASEGETAVKQAALIALTVFVLSIAVWLFLKRTLLARMSTLVEASRRIGSGNLDSPVDVHGNDELAALAAAMEAMRGELRQGQSALQQTARELSAANATIEAERLALADRIAERTRELTRANEDLARARDDAEAASRAKSAFLATVSHEIRTPMNGVLGAMELLARTGLDEKRASLLETAESSARSLLGLLNDLLDMAKIEAGRIEIMTAPAALRAIVNQLVATHTPGAIAHDTRLECEVADDVPEWVLVDALRLQQILGNIVSNAVKFTRGGSITLKVDATPTAEGNCYVQFVVEDSGRGISKRSMSKLFKPFEQGSARFARATGGTGLGLAISRGLADRMGGTIDIQSEVGVGTVVTVAIELEVTKAPRQGKDDISDTQEMAIAALLHDRDIRGDAPLRALVVDDHPVNRMLQSRQLEQLGIDAVVAADGVEALKELGRSHFDLVITDCEMPNMDGFELTSAIRNGDPNYSDMPIVGCTAHALPEVAAQCRECGMDEVLTKPMRLDELAMILRRVVPSAKTPDVPIELQELNGDDPLLNEEQLDQLTGGDRALRGTLMTSFMADHRNTLHELRTALIAGDFDTCRALAHRSKGACGIFGATALSDAFLQLERAASSEPVVRERIANAIDLIANEGERLQQALAAVA